MPALKALLLIVTTVTPHEGATSTHDIIVMDAAKCEVAKNSRPYGYTGPMFKKHVPGYFVSYFAACVPASDSAQEENP